MQLDGAALSRRQRGFESRWGHKIKLPLTRSDTRFSQTASPYLYSQERARDAKAPREPAAASSKAIEPLAPVEPSPGHLVLPTRFSLGAATFCGESAASLFTTHCCDRQFSDLRTPNMCDPP